MLISLLIILILAAILIVALVQSLKNWSWLNAVLVFLVFVMAVVGGYSASQALKARFAWLDRHEKNKEILERYTKAEREALYGPDEAVEFPIDSLVGVETELSLMKMGQGRRWQNGNAANQAGSVQLAFADSERSGAEQLQRDMTVYAFTEIADEQDPDVVYPHQFIGTFSVTEVQGTAVRLVPGFLTELGEAEAADPQTSWTIYEKMPQDERDVFKRLEGITDDNFDFDQYRDLLETKYLTAEDLGMDPESAAYERLIDQFAFNGLTMSEINGWINAQNDRKSTFDPDIDDLYVRIRFTSTSPGFSVDSDTDVGSEPIDMMGLAVDPSLKAGGDIQFAKDEEILVPKRAAIGYERADGERETPVTETHNAERIGEDSNDVYLRPLRDYPLLLTHASEQIQRFEEDTKQLNRALQTTSKALELARQQQATRTKIQNDLENDISNFQRDSSELKRRIQELESELSALRQAIDTYYKQINEMYRSFQDSRDS